MVLTDPEAVAYGLLALYAEDTYTASTGVYPPTPDVRIGGSWDIVGLLNAEDSFLDFLGRVTHGAGNRVYYGFLARNKADPTKFACAIRGTQRPVEWLIDAKFVLVPRAEGGALLVEQGFWGVYQTMNLADPTGGVNTGASAAEAIAAKVGAGSIVVTGHSLGSALATHLTYDLAARLGARATACLFASPQTGDDAWTAAFDAAVGDYRLFNYILDAVTHVPAGDGYATLPKATVIQPTGAQAGIELDLGCNHHLLCYFAMLDYAAERATPTSSADTGSVACVLGDDSKVSEAAKALAIVINELGIASLRAKYLLRGLRFVDLV